ncbi:MAG: ABC transporter permease [Thermomicrobiales bacterium]|nr:ABC transporter permease [Thermomicrobiales bacterium]
MGAYVVRRLIYGLVIIFGASVAAFSLIRVVPGDPARIMAPNASEEQVAKIREDFGYDRPILTQFWEFLTDAVTGDFGHSAFLKSDVSSVIVEGLPYTLRLAISALLLALVVGVTLGTIAAFYQDRFLDRLALGIAVAGQSMPGFWFGLVLILIFSVRLGWAPSFGYKGPKYLILPAITLAISLLATLIRSTRLVMLDVLSQEYIKAARARGLRRTTVIFRHAMPNIFVPLLTIIGVQLGYLLGGAVVVELIFNIPGIGLTVVNAVLRRDYPVVQAVTILMAGGFVLINTVIDVMYGFLDPRIRREMSK